MASEALRSAENEHLHQTLLEENSLEPPTILDEWSLEQRESDDNYSSAKASVWALSSATAIYTSKKLVTNAYCPAKIAVRIFGASWAFYALALYLGFDSSTSPELKSGFQIRRPRLRRLMPDTTWIVMIPASITAAISLPMLLQGILHMPSLAIIGMLVPLVYATETFVLLLSDFRSRSYHEPTAPFRIGIIILASGLVLYNENRLMAPGIASSLIGVLLIGTTRAFFVLGSQYHGNESGLDERLRSYHGFTIMSLCFGLIASSMMSWYFEDKPDPSDSLSWSLIILILLNIVATVLVYSTGSSLLAYSPISFKDASTAYSSSHLSGKEFLASMTSSLLVLLSTFYSHPVIVISWVQIIAYIIAIACVVGRERAHEMVETAWNTIPKIFGLPHKRQSEDDEYNQKLSKRASFLILAILGVALASILCSLESSSLRFVPPKYEPSLDLIYKPISPIDIVVSAFREPPHEIKAMLQAIKSIPFLRTATPTIILYTKDPEANIEELKKSTGADIVRQLDNVGREGATYLHHIVTNWDSLAEKTMFIQAHAHNIRELIPRINNYLVPETGMLSLGFTGVSCKCGDCRDRWGWEDRWNVVPDLYQKIYNHTCEPDTRVLLAYKGQFIVSARRIRGVQKGVYEDLLKALTSEDDWSHDRKIIPEGREDSADNPFFGYTVERIWGLLMQCGIDERVASLCPSLLSGKGRGAEVKDCQCLDP